MGEREMVVVLILWLLCGVLCYFIMKSKGYPNNTCLKHGIGGFLLGFIWLIVVLVKKDYSGNDRLTNIEILEKLAVLRSNGAISEEEYKTQKDQLLGNTQSKDTNTNKLYRCPNCGANVQYGQPQCHCGQVFDWGHGYPNTEQTKYSNHAIKYGTENFRLILSDNQFPITGILFLLIALFSCFLPGYVEPVIYFIFSILILTKQRKLWFGFPILVLCFSSLKPLSLWNLFPTNILNLTWQNLVDNCDFLANIALLLIYVPTQIGELSSWLYQAQKHWKLPGKIYVIHFVLIVVPILHEFTTSQVFLIDGIYIITDLLKTVAFFLTSYLLTSDALRRLGNIRPECGIVAGQRNVQDENNIVNTLSQFSNSTDIGPLTKRKFLNNHKNKVIVLIALVLVAISAFSIHYLIQAKNIVNSDVYTNLRAQTFINLSSVADNISFEYDKKDNAIEISSSIPNIRTTSFNYASLEFYTSWSTLCRTINTSTGTYQEAFSASGYDVDVVNTLYDETNTQVLFVSVNGETVYNYADK